MSEIFAEGLAVVLTTDEQVEDLKVASKSISTLESILELDIEQDCVRKAGSHSRNLLRVKRGLDMVKVLFEQILVSEYVYCPFFLAVG